MFHHINIQGEHAPFANTAGDPDLDLKNLRIDVFQNVAHKIHCNWYI